MKSFFSHYYLTKRPSKKIKSKVLVTLDKHFTVCPKSRQWQDKTWFRPGSSCLILFAIIRPLSSSSRFYVVLPCTNLCNVSKICSLYFYKGTGNGVGKMAGQISPMFLCWNEQEMCSEHTQIQTWIGVDLTCPV